MDYSDRQIRAFRPHKARPGPTEQVGCVSLPFPWQTQITWQPSRPQPHQWALLQACTSPVLHHVLLMFNVVFCVFVSSHMFGLAHTRDFSQKKKKSSHKRSTGKVVPLLFSFLGKKVFICFFFPRNRLSETERTIQIVCAYR